MPRSQRSNVVPSTAFPIERLEPRRLLSAAVPIITQTNLVSDGSVAAAHTDANLVNAWGIAVNPATGFPWVADNGSGMSTVYDSAGNTQLTVSIPGPASDPTSSAPTGVVFHKGKGFDVTSNGASGPSSFIFATEDGTLSGWAPTVDTAHAVLAVDHSATGDVFKGLAIIGSGKSAKIYATDFHNGAVEVFNDLFSQVTLKPGAFVDPSIPAGFAPFGIQAISGKLYVTYAKQDADAHDDVHGPGNGFVDEFSSKGKLIHHIATSGTLNSPWAVALAPSGFGKYKGDLLVGNFGDGTINVFDHHNAFVGQLADANSAPITIDGLWGLVQGDDKKSLFFAAGPNGEANGLFGMLTAVVPKKTKASTTPAATGGNSSGGGTQTAGGTPTGGTQTGGTTGGSTGGTVTPGYPPGY